MLRPGELQFIKESTEDGVPTKIFRDFYGGRWVCMDFEAMRRRDEEKTRNALTAAQNRGDTKSVAYHKRRFVRR